MRTASRTALLVAFSASAAAYVHGPLAAPICRRRATEPQCKAAELLRVAHSVGDIDATAAFYKACLGLEVCEEMAGDAGVVLANPSAGADELRLELRKVDGAKFVEAAGYQHREGAAYQGLMARVPSVAEAVAAATASGGSVLREVQTINHGPALAPVEEADEVENPVVEALVADPSGYPLLLHECEGAPAGLNGCRMAVHEWKASQEWYEQTLGWQTVRWNSNVHREASLTVTLGPKPADPPASPRGYLPEQCSHAVVQLMYIYGGPTVKHPEAGGLDELVLAKADGADAETLSDPDAYKLTIV